MKNEKILVRKSIVLISVLCLATLTPLFATSVQTPLTWRVESESSTELEYHTSLQSYWNRPRGLFGDSVSIGDVNGDGFDDVIVSAKFGGEFGNGEVCVYEGSASGIVSDYTPMVVIEGTGWGAAAAADVNHDGLMDIIITDGYTVDVFYGRAEWTTTYPPLQLDETEADWRARADDFGVAPCLNTVANTGDVNADGIDDVIIGAPCPAADGGKAYVFYGSPTGMPADHAPDGIIEAGEGWQRGIKYRISGGLGTAVAKDGHFIYDSSTADNFIIGVPDADIDLNGDGIYYGNDINIGVALIGPRWWFLSGDNKSYSHFGYALGNAGDVNGDGHSEVLISAKRASLTECKVFLYLGDDDRVNTTLRWPPYDWSVEGIPEVTTWGFGAAVGSAGDINGDGYGDIIIGDPYYNPDEAPGWNGRVYIWLGGPPSAEDPSGLGQNETPETADITLDPQGTWGAFGYSVACGDINGDGLSDIAVGDPTALTGYDPDIGYILGGEVHVFLSVNQRPVADANGPYTGTEGVPVTFDGSGSYDPDGTIVSYEWAFGDGNTGTGVAPTHTYAEPGTYTVTLTVTDNRGATDTDYTTATISAAEPTADFSGTPTSGSEPLTVSFTDLSTSYDGITSWNWDFDNDGIRDSTLQNPTHVYDYDGVYTVALTVYEADGDTDTETKINYIVVSKNAPPVADANGPYSGTEGVPVTFDGSGSYDPDGTIVPFSYKWAFGDGNTGIGVTPTHTYALEGIYTVTLTVTDDDGATDKDTTTATISDADPTADFSGTPRTGNPPLTISFTDLSTSYDGIVSWAWDFGDGDTSTEQNPPHTYADEGTYTVTLTIYEADGDRSRETKVNYIIVSVAPINVVFEEAHLSAFTIGSNRAYEATGGYFEFASYLKANGYLVSTIDPGTIIDVSVLAPVDVLVIVAPMDSYYTSEIDAIETWVRDGGRLLLITDWDGYGVQASTIAARFGFTQPFDMIYDNDENLGYAGWPYYDRANLLVHPVTAGVARVEMYASDGITSAPADEIPLIVTDSDGTGTWSDYSPAIGVSLMSAIDRGGTAGSGRLIVITDSNLWDSAYDYDHDGDLNFYDSDNEILALNAIDWLSAPIHDVAVTDVTPSKTIVTEGYTLSINVTVGNQGDYAETFDVTVYANATPIALQTVTLTSRSSTTITLTWNTIGFALGNYTISAYATPVPGETDTTDNAYINGIVTIIPLGDVNKDSILDQMDLSLIGEALWTEIGDPDYNPDADLNNDGRIDMDDITLFKDYWTKYLFD